MTVYKQDGQPYAPRGSLVSFDPENPTHEYFNRLDQEIIKFGGSPIFYYEVFFGAIDPLYLETRQKLWSQHPVQLYAVYEPVPSQGFVTPFGLDSPDNVTFYLNYQAVLETLGHLPIVGSRLFTPQKREHWEIVERKPNLWQNWGQIRLEIYCTKFQESVTNPAGKVSQAQPDFEID